MVARKNGKTLFAAAIMAYMAYIDGEYGAKLYCLAPKLEQADLAYDAFYQIVQQDEELSEISKKYLYSGVQHDHKEDRVQL